MKKIALISTIFFIFTGLINAKISIRPYLGYGFPTDQNVIGTDHTEDNSFTPAKVQKNENLYFSGGSGFNFGISALYNISENLGLELALTYVTGPETELSKSLRKYTPPQADATTISFLSVSFVPIDISLKISTQTGPLKPYIGFGPSITPGATATATMENKNFEVFSGTYTNSTLFIGETETTFNSGLGYNASIGAEYDLTDSMALNIGFILRFLSLNTDKTILTKYEANGVDQLGKSTTRDKEVLYKEDSSTDEPGDTDQPRIENTEVFSFSSLSFTAGIAFKF
ncbi:MAG: porin family protein [Spirochaetes bacterium]|nr:porin family protein [Spirochaetota bacterium]